MSARSAGREDSAGHLVLEERFAIVPEWLLDADISDLAVRLRGPAAIREVEHGTRGGFGVEAS